MPTITTAPGQLTLAWLTGRGHNNILDTTRQASMAQGDAAPCYRKTANINERVETPVGDPGKRMR
jgi:hypothetical protein